MSRLKSLQKSLPPLILISSLFVIYLRTMAPGLTWANDGSDGGDLITAVATGGVAHPTSYPLYLLLARLFQFLPLGSLAFRTNLLSAIFMVLASVLVYLLVRDLTPNQQETKYWPVALAAGYAFGLAPLVWSQAVITEVYGLQAFLLALILYLYTRPRPIFAFAQRHLDGWRGLALGLGMGNHVTTLLLVPAALALGSCHHPTQPDSASRSWLQNLSLDRGALLRQLGMFVAGLSLYLIIPLRALASPPVNWGNALTLERFWWLASGQLYQSYYLHFGLAELWVRIQAWAALLIQQFGWLGVVLGLTGLIVFGRRSRLFILTTWLAGVFSVFALIYGSDDSYVYLLPVFLSFAIWIGWGLGGLANQFTRWSPLLRGVLALLLIGYLAARSIVHVSQLDASTDVRAETFGREVLSSVPENAVLFATGDRAIFTLWYFHFALDERPDLAVVAVDLLHFDWYQETLHSTYPALVVPAPFPWPETIAQANPSRPVCYVQYSDSTVLDCSQP